MDIRCKNCGQMIDEKDKYCRYCGYLIPEPEPEVTLTAREIEDKVQEEKATITAEKIEAAHLFDSARLQVVHVGEKHSVYVRNLLLTLGAFIVALGLMAVALCAKYIQMDDTLALVLLLVSMFCMIGAFGIALEKYFNTRNIHAITEDKLTVRKYGFVKPAEFLIGGHIFRVEVTGQCDACSGEIIGDLHIERIERVPVVVCNIDRRHCWIIDEEALISDVKAGKVKVLESKEVKKYKKAKSGI